MSTLEISGLDKLQIRLKSTNVCAKCCASENRMKNVQNGDAGWRAVQKKRI